MAKQPTQPGNASSGQTQTQTQAQAQAPDKPKYVSGSQVVTSGRAEKSKNKSTLASKRRGDEDRVFDEMLRDPTIRLAIDVVVAMLKRQEWSVEGSDPAQCAHVLTALEPHREQIIRSGLRGALRDGWRAFEVAYRVDDESRLNTIAGVKPLRAKQTQPLVYEDTGEFAGVQNKGTSSERAQETIEIDERHSFLVNFDDDGFGDLSEPLLRVARGPYDRWENSDEGAQRYDKKVAGGFIFIQYPVGSTPYSANGGAETDNAVIAKDMALNFEAAGHACVPVRVDPETGETVDGPWKVEHVAASGGLQPNFVSRAKYLDALKLRALGVPERSVTEGTFGTKAESEAHADVAVLINVDRHERIVSSVDRGPVRELNLANWNDPKATRLVLAKLDPADRELFAQIFTSLMADPVFGEQIAAQVSVDELLDKLNVPKHEPGDTPLVQPRVAPAPGQPPVPGQPGQPPVPGQPPRVAPGTSPAPAPANAAKAAS